jgi:hypothetical protein
MNFCVLEVTEDFGKDPSDPEHCSLTVFTNLKFLTISVL